jgi:predicted  nucleic acid-binding Zn-ribbon protein
LPTHPQFEELCALATSGQLSAEEASLLDAHLEECDECRRFLSDTRAVSDAVIPRIFDIPRRGAAVPKGMRERFLARTTAQGFRINAGAPLAAPSFAFAESPAISSENQDAIRIDRFGTRLAWFGSRRHWLTGAIAAGACAVCFLLGTVLWTPVRNGLHITSTETLPAAATPDAQAASASAQAEEIRTLTTDRDKLAQQQAELVSDLEAANEQKRDVETALEQKISLLQSAAATDHETLTQQAAALSDRTATLQSQLEALRQKASATEALLSLRQQQTREDAARLESLQAQLASQAQTGQTSGDEVRDLVAARNLHIIDVYDLDANGKRQRAFGRVFYVEGRSLVFYAFDLAAAHAEKKMTFHVWGEHSDDKGTTISLGILHDDDPHEQRWALTYDDPRVLARINFVFVTMEPSNRPVTAPTGKQVLYAYLGGKPNHP